MRRLKVLSFILLLTFFVSNISVSYAQDNSTQATSISGQVVTPQTSDSIQTPTEENQEPKKEEKKDPELSYAKDMGEEIQLAVKQSRLLKFDQEIKRTAVANQEVADIVAVSPKEVLLVAKAHGLTTLIIWTDEDHSYLYNISVKVEGKHLLRLLKDTAPKADIEVYPTDTSFAVKGWAESNLQITKIMEVAESYAPGAVNLMKLKEPKQVLLECRMAEVDRSKAERLGIDWVMATRWFSLNLLTGGGGGIGVDTDKFFSVPAGGILTPPLTYTATAPNTATPGTTALTGFISDRFVTAQTIEAWNQANIFKLIARPNILAKDGEQASFLVGGEFPVVVVTNNTVNIEFKEFGTKLNFKPEFVDEETMKLTIEPEVSELDATSGVTLDSVVVPGLITRKAKTVVDLKDGQSFVLGGLLFDSITKVHTKVPLLGDVPYIGALVKHEFDHSSEKELLVIVTPHVVKPLDTTTGKKELYPVKKINDTIKFIDAQTGGMSTVKLNENVTDVTDVAPRLLPWMNNKEGYREPSRTLKQVYRDEIRDTIKPRDPAIKYATENTHGIIEPQDSNSSSSHESLSSSRPPNSDSSYLDGI